MTKSINYNAITERQHDKTIIEKNQRCSWLHASTKKIVETFF